MFSELLLASEPHAAVADEMMLFGSFVGDWDMQVQFFDREGNTSWTGPGLWSFAWILDGRAIQDVLMYDSAESFPAPPGARRIGTSIRYYNPTEDIWRMTWVGATAGIYLTFAARRVGAGISIVGADTDGSPLEWVFSDITPNSFEWMGRTAAGGGPWWIEQKMVATRRARQREE
ncbi:MAG: hypothetical protein PVG83_06110 [Acidimicrobiia bacterium]|jgi:hypothetical protein